MLDRGEKVALLFVVAIAGAVMGMWFFPSLGTLAPPIWSKMTANSSLGMLLAASSLALSAERRSKFSVRLSRIAAVALFVLGALTLVEFAAGISLGIDQWLPYSSHSRYPGRPSPQTSAGFALAGACLLLIREYKNGRSRLADVLALSLVGLVLVLLGGYIYGALQVVGVDSSTLTSPQTLFCFACLALIIAARRAKSGRLISVLVNVGIGSQVVRKVLPGVVLLPFAGFAIVGHWIESGVMPGYYARAIMAPLESFVILGVVIWMAWRINDLERDLRDMSLTDELTGVLNRRGFYLLGEQALRETRRAGTALTVLFFDLDGLKKANDTYGHDIGSQFVADVAELLRMTFRGADIVARVGGDEFAVVTHGNSASAKAALTRISDAAAALNQARTKRYEVSYSVGEASIDPADHDEPFIELVARADAKMYEQKQAKQARQAA